MITTLTLNPAIDKTIITKNFNIDQVNTVNKAKINVGGKGINVSRVVKSIGLDTTIIGILAGENGKTLEKMINELDIKNDFIWVDGETRINLKIVDSENATCTDLNETGPNINKATIEKIKNKIIDYSEKTEIFVLAGNANKSVTPTIYKDIINALPNKKIMLDTSGEYLKEGIKAVPWFIKPNIYELSEILGKKLVHLDDIIYEAKVLVSTGITYVCISMGARGLLLVTEKETILATPPKIKPMSTVGAGDCVVGSMAISLLRGDTLENAMRYACAISSASATLEGTDIPSKELINKFYNMVDIVTADQMDKKRVPQR